MPADYHTHTPLCGHAVGQPQQYVEAALASEVTEYGISDHAPMSPEPFDDWRMKLSQLPQYLDWIAEAEEHAGGRLIIRKGLECDWIQGCESWTETLAARADWDYLIGSVHYLGGKFDFDNPKWLGRWAELDVEDAWQSYWQSYIEMAESGLFTFLGHPDLIKKFNYTPKGDLSRYYDPVIESIAANGCMIELNTAGWYKPCEEQYPQGEFLELACQAGIGLVISSDAHAPAEVGRDFDRAVELARIAGYQDTMLIGNGEITREPFEKEIFIRKNLATD